MASGDMKEFYRQKKTGGAITKPPSSSSKKRPGKAASGGATLGAGNPAQTPALLAHGSFDLEDEYGEEEERLRQFDMDMRYGPCIGITRLERWERASSMGLDPPADVPDLLHRSSSSGPKPGLECLWEGRV